LYDFGQYLRFFQKVYDLLRSIFQKLAIAERQVRHRNAAAPRRFGENFPAEFAIVAKKT